MSKFYLISFAEEKELSYKLKVKTNFKNNLFLFSKYFKSLCVRLYNYGLCKGLIDKNKNIDGFEEEKCSIKLGPPPPL